MRGHHPAIMALMRDLTDFLARCDRVASALGIARATLSTRIFNDGKRLQQIFDGGDLGLRRYDLVDVKLREIEAEAASRSTAP